MLRLFSHAAPSLLRSRSLWPAEPFSAALFEPLLSPFPLRDVVSRETATLRHPVMRQEDGSYKMEVYLDLHAFKPSEVSVGTKDGQVVVEANAERQSEDGSLVSSSGLKRAFPLPSGVSKEELRATFTEDGGVLLEAPCRPPPQDDTAETAVKGDTPLEIKHH